MLVMQTATVVAAYLSQNVVSMEDLPRLISTVSTALQNIGTPSAAPVAEPVQLSPGAIKKSITDDFIICLEDGKKFKSMKRHLSSKYGLTPAQYRKKWGLPSDYPMAAPSYAKERSDLARAAGLGSKKALGAAAA
jgi:predicted transcriptional regulator